MTGRVFHQWMLAGVLLASTLTAESAAQKPKMMVLVYHDPQVPTETISKALLGAHRIFFNAGIESEWKMAKERKPYPGYAISLRILRRRWRQADGDEPMGTTLVDQNG